MSTVFRTAGQMIVAGLSRSVELSQLSRKLTLCVFDIHDDHEIKSCYGDICEIVDALQDYAQLLEMVCDTWGLLGFHRATYELRAGEPAATDSALTGPPWAEDE